MASPLQALVMRGPDSPFAPCVFPAVPLRLNSSRIDRHKGRGLGQRLVLTKQPDFERKLRKKTTIPPTNALRRNGMMLYEILLRAQCPQSSFILARMQSGID